MISEYINKALVESGHPELVLSKSESQFIDNVLLKPIDKYIWIAVVILALLGLVLIVLPRVLTVLKAKSEDR